MYGNKLMNSYSIVSELGYGGNGAVYKAWHKGLRKHIVIKELKDSSVKATEVQRNEAEALKNVKSLYIPQVFDFVTQDNNSYTVMEYIEGDSFDKLLKYGRMFTEIQIIKWYYQIASALEAIHKHNICHRDIKPANIMLMPDGNVCLIDFNTALVSGNNTKVVNRSTGYASPEQYMYFQICDDYNRERASFVAEPGYSYNSVNTDGTKNETLIRSKYSGYMNAAPIDWKLSDIYSLGATIYHLLTGKRPPALVSEKTIAANLKNDIGNVSNIVKRSMKNNPEKRFQSATDLCKAICTLMW